MGWLVLEWVSRCHCIGCLALWRVAGCVGRTGGWKGEGGSQWVRADCGWPVGGLCCGPCGPYAYDGWAWVPESRWAPRMEGPWALRSGGIDDLQQLGWVVGCGE